MWEVTDTHHTVSPGGCLRQWLRLTETLTWPVGWAYSEMGCTSLSVLGRAVLGLPLISNSKKSYATHILFVSHTWWIWAEAQLPAVRDLGFCWRIQVDGMPSISYGVIAAWQDCEGVPFCRPLSLIYISLCSLYNKRTSPIRLSPVLLRQKNTTASPPLGGLGACLQQINPESSQIDIHANKEISLWTLIWACWEKAYWNG